MGDSKLVLAFLCIAVGIFHQAEGHGYMKDPPGRASAWRFGFKTPRNYEDDPVQGPLRHQAGGRFATGTITKTYTAGSTININVFITTQHGGWYEFSICPVNDK